MGKARVPLTGGKSADGTTRPGLPETSQKYAWSNRDAGVSLGNDMPQQNMSFRVPLTNRGEPDFPKQAGKNAQIPKVTNPRIRRMNNAGRKV